MRVDLFLKTARIVKRRTIAQELCEAGKVLVNDHAAKPGKEVRSGDLISLLFNTKRIEIEVLHVPASRGNIDAATLYRVVAEKKTTPEYNA